MRHFLQECIAPRTTQIQTRGSSVSFAVLTQTFLCVKFSTARLEILPNLRHEGVFQMGTSWLTRTWISRALGLDFKSLVQALNLTR